MEAAMMTFQAAAPPYYCFPTEADTEAGQHGRAVRRQLGLHQMSTYPHPMTSAVPSKAVYTRPDTSCSQPATAPTLYSNGGPAMLTPMASPRLVAHKPIALETDIRESSPFHPSTPPLSGSCSVGSPASCDALQTPMNPMFSGMDGLKDGFDIIDNLSLDWPGCASPPMTPLYIQPQPSKASLTSAPGGSFFFSSQASPVFARSPFPSTCSRASSSEPTANFCDPRNLTVGSSSAAPANPALAHQIAPPPATTEETKVATLPHPAASNFQFDASTIGDGFVNLDRYSELDPEVDYLSPLVNPLDGLPEQPLPDLRRPRAATGSSVVSLGHGSFISEDDFGFDEAGGLSIHCLPSPPSSCPDEDSHHSKRLRMSSLRMSGNESSHDDPDSGASSPRDFSLPNPASPSTSPSQEPTSASVPPNRRGRKQSLTEDPSKTFKCDLCPRSFRRQEHLKRHHRSLHTGEKPFVCTDCNKTFSRSDNLAQHARTHGSGAIQLDLIQNSGYGVPMMADYDHYGKILFQLASEVPGSSSDDDSDARSKKRKRST